MKNFIAILFAIFCLASSTANASAQEQEQVYEWGRILNKTTYLYNSADTLSPCFLLPETYYVKLIDQTGEYYLVKYTLTFSSILGYVKKSDIYLCDYQPQEPFLNYKVEIKSGAKGYLNSDCKNFDYVFNSGNLVYLFGKYQINEQLYYYISAFNQHRYYISASDCQAVSYPYNTDPLPVIDPVQPETPQTPQDQNIAPSGKSGTATVFIIFAIIAPVLAAAIYLLKPQKHLPQKKQFYYDENEYE